MIEFVLSQDVTEGSKLCKTQKWGIDLIYTNYAYTGYTGMLNMYLMHMCIIRLYIYSLEVLPMIL